ncbi:hypothetical protein ABZ372_26090 [Streptomyces sp. NPDC005921]
MELALWLIFGTAMFYSMVVLPAMHPERFVGHIGDYLVFMVLMGYLRNVRYLDFPRRGMGFIKRFGMFLLAPLYGVIQLLLLTPLRFYALLTLGKGTWGTRQGGVEVSVAGGHEQDVSAVWEEEDEYSSSQVSSTIEMMRLEGIALARTAPHASGRHPEAVPAQAYTQHSEDELRELGRSPQPPVAWNGVTQQPQPVAHDPYAGQYQQQPAQPYGQWQQGQVPEQGQGHGQGHVQGHGPVYGGQPYIPHIPQQPQAPDHSQGGQWTPENETYASGQQDDGWFGGHR